MTAMSDIQILIINKRSLAYELTTTVIVLWLLPYDVIVVAIQFRIRVTASRSHGSILSTNVVSNIQILSLEEKKPRNI